MPVRIAWAVEAQVVCRCRTPADERAHGGDLRRLWLGSFGDQVEARAHLQQQTAAGRASLRRRFGLVVASSPARAVVGEIASAHRNARAAKAYVLGSQPHATSRSRAREVEAGDGRKMAGGRDIKWGRQCPAPKTQKCHAPGSMKSYPIFFAAWQERGRLRRRERDQLLC